MFPINTHLFSSKENEPVHDAVRKATHGHNLIGYGYYSTVFSKDDSPEVVKVTNWNDHGYLTFLKVMQELSIENPYLPRIIDVNFFGIVGYSNNLFGKVIVRMEKLRAGEFVNAWSGPDDTEFGVECFNIRTATGSRREYKLDPLLEEAVTVVELAHDRGQSLRYRMRYDLHCQNFLLRGNQIVFADPLAS